MVSMWDFLCNQLSKRNQDSVVILATSLGEEPPRNRSSSPATLRAFSTPHNIQSNSWIMDTWDFITGTKAIAM